MIDQEVEEQAILLREFSQDAGISNPNDAWEDISDSRKARWRSLASAMKNAGYCVVPREELEIQRHDESLADSWKGWDPPGDH